MSGGIAYILDRDGDFHVRCNQDQCSLEGLTDTEEIEDIRKMIHRHAGYTHSSLAWEILADWNKIVSQFVKVMPDDYKRILTAYEDAQKEGLQDDDAWLSAFQRGIEVSVNV